MLNFRRVQALAAALVVTVLLIFLSSSHSSSQSLTEEINGSLQNKNIQKPGHDKLDTTSSSSTPSILAPPPTKANKQQIALNALSQKPLRQQLAYQFPYQPSDKFPAYIWQTWRVTPASSEFPQDWRPFEASWTELHPGFVHEVIDDTASIHVLRHLYSGIPDVVAAYEALAKPVLRADFFRYLILLARGGIYSDIDTTALKPAFQWVPETVPRTSYGLVIGIEADPDREDWAEWYSRRIQFCQWTIQAKPGHPVLREIVSHITEETLRRAKEGTLGKVTHGDDDGVMEFTGPGIWTDIIFNFFNDPTYFDIAGSKLGNITWRQFTNMTQAKKVGDVVVLPITSFSPGVGQMNAGPLEDPMAFVHHRFEGSWKPGHSI